jgi:SAM-dependent MidA family methyltransferase
LQVSSEQILAKLISTQSECGGVLPWREFMRLALFDPDFGYYSKSISQIGPRGDFTTAPALASILARMVYFWQKAKRQMNSTLRRSPFIEIGAGNGEFARQFLRSRSLWSRRTPYWIVETSPPLQKLQQNLLHRLGVRWFPSVAAALKEANGCAILFSNELVDAFPCSRWVYKGSQWLECGLQIQDGIVHDITFPSPLPDSTIFGQPHLNRESQFVETHESYRDWLLEWSPLTRNAAMLTIDYGAKASDLYHKQPSGSLRAFWQQQRLTGPSIYSRIGRQDLTADVNFSDLEKWSILSGFSFSPSMTLGEWLRMQISLSGGLLREPVAGMPEARFLDAGDAGGAFMVLECEKLRRL